MTTFALSLPEDDEYSDCECLTEVKLTFIVIQDLSDQLDPLTVKISRLVKTSKTVKTVLYVFIMTT